MGDFLKEIIMKSIDINIVEADVDIIAHCCNCQNTMGSGVARAIRDKWPEVYEADCETKKGDVNKFGKFSLANIKNPDNRIKKVYNLYGQYSYGRERRQVNYEKMYSAIELMRNDIVDRLSSIEDQSKIRVGFPHGMASMRAGGDWRIIEKMIEVIFEKTNIEVCICKYVE